MELLPLNFNEQQSHDHDQNNNNNNDEKEAAASAPLSDAGPSPFVGEWQGKSVSFMRSNDHQTHETQRTWDTSGLQGLPLKFVQGDQSARNWWRKVLLYILPIMLESVCQYVNSLMLSSDYITLNSWHNNIFVSLKQINFITCFSFI